MNDLIQQCESDLAAAVLAIQQPRTNFQIQHFVVGQHDTEPRRWHQCVLELQIKIQLLKRAEIERRMTLRKIERLRQSSELDSRDQADLLTIDLEAHELAVLGAVREAETLYAIYKSFGRTYTREELDAAETEYWQLRLTRQAKHELIANGRIGVGNLDSLEQIGQSVTQEFIQRLGLELCEPNSQTQSTITNQTQAK
jgi:hypothetical protein